MIRLAGICRTYDLGGRAVHALVDVDEVIEQGEHVAIMGPSGSGKSTLLNVIGCLDRPTSGSFALDGKDIDGLSEQELDLVRRHRIGFVFQSFHLVGRLSAVENVELPMVFAEVPRKERRRRALAHLDAVGLTPRADHRPDQLSGGERQRVALARATVMEPAILLADEPTGNLDTTSGRQILDLLDRMNDEGLTLIVVTHDPNVARRADRLLVLVDGRIAKRLPAAEIRSLDELFALPAGSPGEDAGDVDRAQASDGDADSDELPAAGHDGPAISDAPSRAPA
ncbi:MAG: ABC transporter ATP-binding protein [Holophagales bacterium]|nr:ABC transporter ATP-binding protein [Holophagales bacterium]